MKYFLFPILLFFPLGRAIAQAKPPDHHLREAGTSALCARSAFAHGYRHGYENGYHLGNIDVNMARQPRAKLPEFHAADLRYSPEFGSRKSFQAGFEDGLKAGYSDGFVGRKFRAVRDLRSVSTALDQNPVPSDPANTYFDQGVWTGYSQGLESGKSSDAMEQLPPDFDRCPPFQPSRQEDSAAQSSFCDGYQRGYRLGHADGIVFIPDINAMARK